MHVVYYWDDWPGIDRVEAIRRCSHGGTGRRKRSGNRAGALGRGYRCRGGPVGTVLRPNQLFRWLRLYAEGALSAVGASKKMLPRLRIPGLAEHVREPQRLLDKKMSENEILRTVLDLAQPRTPFAFALTPAGRHAMKTITDASEWRARTSSLRQPLLHRAVAGVSPKLTSLSQLFRHVRC